MVEHLVLCGGLTRRRRAGERTLRLDAREPDGNVRLWIEDLSRKLAANVPHELVDLLDIATYVHAADGATRRGGPTMRGMGADWRRSFRFVIPVRCPDMWTSAGIQELLSDTLGFLSEDSYEFDFEGREGLPDLQQYMGLAAAAGEGRRSDEVLLFSGGLDSLAGAVEELNREDRNIILVSHRSSTKIGAVQNKLASALRHRAPDRVLHVPVRMHKAEDLGVEYTLRSRSFFFSALGIVVGRMLDVERIRLHENGVVSLNLPIASHVLGARATRSTHPRVLDAFNRLFETLLGKPVTIENHYALLTKAEVVGRIADHGHADLVQHAVSCTRVHEMRKERPHCGTCTQCLGRRFAVLAAGLEQHDPEHRYRVKLFVDEREEGDERTIALSYVRLAVGLGQMSDWDFLHHYGGEISRAARYLSGPTARSGQPILDLHRRHGRSVIDVLKRALREHEDELAGLSLPSHCLLRLVFGPDATPLLLPEMAPKPEDEAARSTAPPAATPPEPMPLTITAIALDRTKQRILIEGLPPLHGPLAYALMGRLVAQYREDQARGLRHDRYNCIQPDDLANELHIKDLSLRREISRIRKKVGKTFLARYGVPLNQQALIDNLFGKGYRLNPKVQVLDPSQVSD